MSNMVINTNVLALNAHRSMKATGISQARASQRLSSGLRINSAADDAAGLAISEKMRAQIRGLDMASRNAQDAISLVQTAEGGLQEISNMVQRIRELIVYASNDTMEHNDIGTGDRQKVQDEIDQLVQEIDSMAERVEFNKKTLVNGDWAGVPLDGGVSAATMIQAEAAFATEDAAFQALRADVAVAGDAVMDAKEAFRGFMDNSNILNAFDALVSMGAEFDDPATLSAVTAARDALQAARTVMRSNTVPPTGLLTTGPDETAWDDFLADEWDAVTTAVGAMDAALTADANFDAYRHGLHGGIIYGLLNSDAFTDAVDAAYDDLNDAVDLVEAAIPDWADALATVEIARALHRASPVEDRLYFQIGANANQGLRFSINSVKSDALHIGNGQGRSTISVLEATGADITNLLSTLDVAVSDVTTERSRLGAIQNRLDFTIRSLDISSENLSASESRVRDADMAKEMMNLTKANVLQQAAISMLAQANQAPQSILQLLR